MRIPANICVSVGKATFTECVAVAKSAERLELRLDMLSLSDNELKSICNAGAEVIATCRLGPKLSVAEQLSRLRSGLVAGAAYIDIEMEAPPQTIDTLKSLVLQMNKKLILSHHNHESTPPLPNLHSIVAQSFELGADLVKVITTATKSADNASVLSLLRTDRSVVAFCMGERGKLSRILAPFFGAPFTYAAADEDATTAPGQISAARMLQIWRELGQ